MVPGHCGHTGLCSAIAPGARREVGWELPPELISSALWPVTSLEPLGLLCEGWAGCWPHLAGACHSHPPIGTTSKQRLHDRRTLTA